MCTVTLIRHADVTVVTMNRDERKNRQESSVRQASTTDGIDYLFPVDTLSGGTWLGVNAFGIGACLLNRYGETHLHKGEDIISRGTIIPSLLGSRCLNDAYRQLDKLPLERFRNFDLLVFDDKAALHCTHENGVGSSKRISTDRLMLTSSSWNPAPVLAYRRQKFSLFLNHQPNDQAPATSVLQNFHLASSDDPRFDVLMNRSETHTKSVSQLIMTQDSIQFHYLDERALGTLMLPSRAASPAGNGVTLDLKKQH